MNLIKINTDHYVVVDDSEIKYKDWYLDDTNQVRMCVVLDTDYWKSRKEYKKITHSTRALEPIDGRYIYYRIQPLSLQEVKELIGEVDVEKKAEKFIGCEYADIEDNIDQVGYDSFIRGYTQCLEDNKDRKYTREEVHGLMCKAFIQGWKKYDVVEAGLEGLDTDVECAWILMRYDTTPLKTQWIVDFVDGKLKLKQ